MRIYLFLAIGLVLAVVVFVRYGKQPSVLIQNKQTDNSSGATQKGLTFTCPPTQNGFTAVFDADTAQLTFANNHSVTLKRTSKEVDPVQQFSNDQGTLFFTYNTSTRTGDILEIRANPIEGVPVTSYAECTAK